MAVMISCSAATTGSISRPVTSRTSSNATTMSGSAMASFSFFLVFSIASTLCRCARCCGTTFTTSESISKDDSSTYGMPHCRDSTFASCCSDNDPCSTRIRPRCPPERCCIWIARSNCSRLTIFSSSRIWPRDSERGRGFPRAGSSLGGGRRLRRGPPRGADLPVDPLLNLRRIAESAELDVDVAQRGVDLRVIGRQFRGFLIRRGRLLPSLHGHMHLGQRHIHHDRCAGRPPLDVQRGQPGVGHGVTRRQLQYLLIGIDRVVELAARFQAPGFMKDQRALQRRIAVGNAQPLFEFCNVNGNEPLPLRARWNPIASSSFRVDWPRPDGPCASRSARGPDWRSDCRQPPAPHLDRPGSRPPDPTRIPAKSFPSRPVSASRPSPRPPSRCWRRSPPPNPSPRSQTTPPRWRTHRGPRPWRP